MVAPGWARATCSGPVKASLLYRGYDSAGVAVAEAGVNATAVPATRFVTFAEQGEGKPGTGVAYANPPTHRPCSPLRPRTRRGRRWPASLRNCRPTGMMRRIWRPCSVSRALPDGSKSPPRSPSSVCRSMPKPLPYSPPCLRGKWMPPRRDRLPITSRILPWAINTKPRLPISTTPPRR